MTGVLQLFQRVCCRRRRAHPSVSLYQSLIWRALRRRSAQTTDAGGDEKEAVKSYFNSVGFERWNRIYGTTDDINSVRASA